MDTLPSIMQRIWTILGRNSEQIKITSGVFVAVFVLWEYYGHVQDTRVDRALSYISDHHNPQNMTARIKSRLFWWNNPERISVLSQIGDITKSLESIEALDVAQTIAAYKKDDAEIGDTIAEQYIISLVSEEALQSDLHNLQNFYYSTAHCTLSGVCDEETMCRALYSDIFVFEEVYKGYFQIWSNLWLENKSRIIGEFLEVCDRPEYLGVPPIMPVDPYRDLVLAGDWPTEKVIFAHDAN